MKRIARALAAAATLGLSTVALSGPALAWGLGYGNGPTYYGEYAPLAYDSYAFGYEYPAYSGGEVTATAVESVQLSLSTPPCCWTGSCLLSRRSSARISGESVLVIDDS